MRRDFTISRHSIIYKLCLEITTEMIMSRTVCKLTGITITHHNTNHSIAVLVKERPLYHRINFLYSFWLRSKFLYNFCYSIFCYG